MQITRVELTNFRNHLQTGVDWGSHLNVISGPNGAGKTNLIDAIHYLCMSRSFVSNSDTYVVHHDESFFSIIGYFQGNLRSDFKVTCSYSRGEGKKIFVNDSPLDRLSDLIGMVPVVVLSPEDKKLTSEGPSERRSFLDSFISQLSSRYLADLFDYRKILKQRNQLLSKFAYNQAAIDDYLEPWNIQLVEVGARIVAKRTEILNQFSDFMKLAYSQMTGINHQPRFVYKTFCEPSNDPERISESFSQLLKDNANKEKEVQYTLTGPHRDDIVFYLDDFELRKYGSQGQHRLFAISLKLAQLFFFSRELEDLPILLLDDVFGDLDPHKIEILLDMLSNHEGQIFITAANRQPFDQHIDFLKSGNKNFLFENDEIVEQN